MYESGVLDAIQQIDDVTLESEMNVICAMIDYCYKQSIILEYCDDSEASDIFQESSETSKDNSSSNKAYSLKKKAQIMFVKLKDWFTKVLYSCIRKIQAFKVNRLLKKVQAVPPGTEFKLKLDEDVHNTFWELDDQIKDLEDEIMNYLADPDLSNIKPEVCKELYIRTKNFQNSIIKNRKGLRDASREKSRLDTYRPYPKESVVNILNVIMNNLNHQKNLLNALKNLKNDAIFHNSAVYDKQNGASTEIDGIDYWKRIWITLTKIESMFTTNAIQFVKACVNSEKGNSYEPVDDFEDDFSEYITGDDPDHYADEDNE